jgi:6-phosphogluconate dehydrogenase
MTSDRSQRTLEARNFGAAHVELGIIGLGRMGANMAQRLIRGGHRVVGFDLDANARATIERFGAETAPSLAELTTALRTPRTLWMMVPAGNATDSTIDALLPLLAAEDTLIDGGNSNYKDTVRRSARLTEARIHYVDCGTSGGIWGLDQGYCLMIGGDEAVVERLRSVFATLAPAADCGWARVGPSGAGHFSKMIHNGIEYGLMQAYAEGFSILAHRRDLDLAQIAQVWRHGSVVRSWLLDLIANALAQNPTMEGIAPHVDDSGEGRWTVAEAIDLNVPAPVITQSLIQRLRSRDRDSFADKLLSTMRNQFGGHEMKRE